MLLLLNKLKLIQFLLNHKLQSTKLLLIFKKEEISGKKNSTEETVFKYLNILLLEENAIIDEVIHIFKD